MSQSDGRLARLYGRRALLCKACGELLLPVLVLLMLSRDTDGDPLVWLYGTTLLVGCLYTLPFWCTLVCLRASKTRLKIRRFVALDALSCLLPPFASVLTYETVQAVRDVSASSLNGLYTLLLGGSLLLISCLFWALYFLAARFGKK